MQKITPCLWFDTEAEEAAELYVSLFADAKILEVTHYGEAGPRPAGTVMTVSFMLEGQEYLALNGGPEFPFTEAVSFSVSCEDQEEVDRLWARLLEGGGVESQCGWLKDRFGLSWQIIPTALPRLLARPGPGAGPARDGRDAADGQDRHRGPGEGGRRGLTDERPQRRRASSRRPVRNARSASLSVRASASSYAVAASARRPSRRSRSARVAGR